jgi:hypothetical protein
MPDGDVAEELATYLLHRATLHPVEGTDVDDHLFASRSIA